MKTLQQLMLLVCILIQSNHYGQTKDIKMVSEKYNSFLKEQNKGIAILVKKDDKIETTSLGNHNLNEQSVFNIGSATKTFTAILILQEMEKGNLKLTDFIDDYLTSIPNVDGSLSIEALLTHESGIDEVIGKNLVDIFYSKNDSIYSENLLYKIGKNNPEMVGNFNYSNTNYLLLGKILEKVTDQNYFDLLRERILIPLNMNNTYPYLHKNIPNLATPYNEEKDIAEYLNYRFFANIAHAAGSIASTLSDMEIFYTSLFETEKLLKKETVKMMMKSGNETYGYGIFKSDYNGKKYYNHGGNNIGYAFRNEYDPVTKDMFLMFSNSIAIPSQKLIKDDLLAYINNEPIENFEKIDIDKFKNYAGTYLIKEANMTFQITVENNKMFLLVESQGIKSELAQKNEKSVYDTTVGAILTVIEESENSLTFHQNGFTTTVIKEISKD